jgi:septal ring factor EnvC (AmiA/AmiB activator)
MHKKRAATALFTLTSLLLAPAHTPEAWAARRSATPAPAAEVPLTSKRDELKDLRGRLEDLQHDLEKTEQDRATASDQLKEVESAISGANRRLRELAGQRNETEAALDDLKQRTTRLESQLAVQQKQLGRLLYRQHVSTDIDALRLLLSGNDANQAARDLHYLTLLSRAKATMLQTLRQSLDEEQRLAAATRTQRNQLITIEAQQQQQRATLISRQQQRQAMLTQLASQAKSQRQEIATLKRDEARLGRLIDTLARKAADRARAARRAALAAAVPRAARPATDIPPNPAPNTPQNTPPSRHAASPAANPDDTHFDGLKNPGRLRLPVTGQLLHRFGSRRAEGGTVWKGLFIRADEGSEVRALAAGRVVFADWLRGFGNLLIVDHGDDWLSVYGNNQSLFRQVGDAVKPGETIAAVGNTGGNAQSGLYFELRQQGRAIDPLRWIQAN